MLEEENVSLWHLGSSVYEDNIGNSSWVCINMQLPNPEGMTMSVSLSDFCKCLCWRRKWNQQTKHYHWKIWLEPDGPMQLVFPKDVKISPSHKVPTLSESKITGTNCLTSVRVPWGPRGQCLSLGRTREIWHTLLWYSQVETSIERRTRQVNRHLLSPMETFDCVIRITCKLRCFNKWATGAKWIWGRGSRFLEWGYLCEALSYPKHK